MGTSYGIVVHHYAVHSEQLPLQFEQMLLISILQLYKA